MLVNISISGAKYLVNSLEGEVSLSNIYQFKVALGLPDISFAKKCLAKNVIIEFKQLSYSSVYLGTITCVSVLDALPIGENLCELIVESVYSKLKLHGGLRSYHNKTVIECVESILLNHNFRYSFVNNCTKEYSKIPFWQQHDGETDLEFIKRILSQNGIYWYTVANTKNNIEEFVVCDNSIISSELVEHNINLYKKGSMEELDPNVLGAHSLTVSTNVLADNIRVVDHNNYHPTKHIQSNLQSNSKNNNNLSYTEHLGYGLDDKELLEQNNLLLEYKTLQSNTSCIKSNISYLNINSKFKLSNTDLNANHIISEINESYFFITSIKHYYSSGNQPESLGEYSNELKIILATYKYRDNPICKGQLSQNLVASVDSYENTTKNNQEAYLDNHGNYKVNILDNLSELQSGKRSHWLPKMQPYTGRVAANGISTGWHQPLLPRTETLVGFLDNNHNKPFIIGAMYNSCNTNVVTNNNNYQSVWCSRSNNKFIIDDQNVSFRISTDLNNNSIFLKSTKTKNAEDINDTRSITESKSLNTQQQNGVFINSKFGKADYYAGNNFLHNIDKDYFESTNSNYSERVEDKYKLESSAKIYTKVANDFNLTSKKDIELISSKDTNITVANNFAFRANNLSSILSKKADVIIQSEDGNVDIKANQDIIISGKGHGDITIGFAGTNASGIKIKPNGAIECYGNNISFDADNIVLEGTNNNSFDAPKLPSISALSATEPQLPETFTIDCDISRTKKLASYKIIYLEEFEDLETSDSKSMANVVEFNKNLDCRLACPRL